MYQKYKETIHTICMWQKGKDLMLLVSSLGTSNHCKSILKSVDASLSDLLIQDPKEKLQEVIKQLSFLYHKHEEKGKLD